MGQEQEVGLILLRHSWWLEEQRVIDGPGAGGGSNFTPSLLRGGGAKGLDVSSEIVER